VPRYTYRCNNCDTTTDIFHLAEENVGECPQCNISDVLTRVIAQIRTPGKQQSSPSTRVGKVTEDFILEARQDLKQQKIDAGNKK